MLKPDSMPRISHRPTKMFTVVSRSMLDRVQYLQNIYDINNLRPVSNLSFSSKVIEKNSIWADVLLSGSVWPYAEASEDGFIVADFTLRRCHRLWLREAACPSWHRCSLDMVDHDILLTYLSAWYGFTDHHPLLEWIPSFLEWMTMVSWGQITQFSAWLHVCNKQWCTCMPGLLEGTFFHTSALENYLLLERSSCEYIYYSF